MATRKKTKVKAKKTRKKKKTATRPAARKRAVRKSAGKKTAAKKRLKATPKRAKAKKTKPRKAASAKAKPKARPKKASPGRVARSTRVEKGPASPAPAWSPRVYSEPEDTPAPEQQIGTVTHYFTHLGVAIVKLESGSLREGDVVRIKGHTSDFTQPIESMEIEHARVSEAHPGQSVGLRVNQHAREHDAVYKVEG